MASYEKRGKVWRARTVGRRESATFPTKAEAVAWANERERAYRAVQAGGVDTRSLRYVLNRFAEEVSPKRKGKRWEVLRLNALSKQLPDKPMNEVTPEDIGRWRDKRLQQVKPSTVNRELNLLGAVFEHARLEWRYVLTNAVRDVSRPTNPPHRKRLMTDAERDRLCLALGYTGPPITTLSQQVAVAMLLALETCMRAGEIIGLEWANVHRRHVTLPQTKNGDARDVPLSSRAVELLGQMRGIDPVRVFTVDGPSRDALFRKARNRCKLAGVTFHDTRHTAITRLAQSRKLDVLELARMIGHRDLKSLMIYFNPTADELAERLG